MEKHLQENQEPSVGITSKNQARKGLFVECRHSLLDLTQCIWGAFLRETILP